MKFLEHTGVYLRGVFGLIGIKDITVFRAEGIGLGRSQSGNRWRCRRDRQIPFREAGGLTIESTNRSRHFLILVRDWRSGKRGTGRKCWFILLPPIEATRRDHWWRTHCSGDAAHEWSKIWRNQVDLEKNGSRNVPRAADIKDLRPALPTSGGANPYSQSSCRRRSTRFRRMCGTRRRQALSLFSTELDRIRQHSRGSSDFASGTKPAS